MEQRMERKVTIYSGGNSCKLFFNPRCYLSPRRKASDPLVVLAAVLDWLFVPVVFFVARLVMFYCDLFFLC